MASRQVLFIAYHFPPLGGGGVQRNAKFARYLPRFGFEPFVVTGSGGADDRWAPIDSSLDADVSERLLVLRVAGPEPSIKGGWPRRLERVMDRRSAFSRWWTEGLTDALQRVRADIELVYASLVPYDTAFPVAEFARRMHLPWIADLQDPWALDEMWIYPTALHRHWDIVRMRRVLGTASAIVMNTPEAVKRICRAFPELERKIVVSIPNGYDSADFAQLAPPDRTDGRFRIVHTGYLHTEEGLRLHDLRRLRAVVGGTATSVDVLTRSHVFLLKALRLLVREDPELAGIVEVVLAGVLTETDRAVAADCPYVRFPGYLAHHETIALMRSADLLFLPMQEVPRDERAGLVPGKTYEYLASGRPILAAVPYGDARDIVEAAGNASVCWPSDVGAIAAAIRDRIAAWRSGSAVELPDSRVVEQFERTTLTRHLADIFDSVGHRSDP